jgi:uncharacterized membrane protein
VEKVLNNLKNNIKNKTWWIAVISLLIVILQSRGLDLTKYIGVDWQITLNNIFTLLALIGISVDTTVVNTKAETDDENLTKTLSDTKLEQIKTILNQ